MLRRILSVFGANIFAQASTILIQVLSVPVFLHYWGAALYGEWLMLTALPSYLIVSGSGIGYVAGNTMQKHLASGQPENARAVFQSSWLVTLGLSFLLFMIITPLVLFFPFTEWMHMKQVSWHEASLSMFLFTIYILMSLQCELFTGVYRANGKFARGIVITNILRLLEFTGTMTMVFLGFRFIAVATLLLAVRLSGIAWMIFDFRNLLWVRFGFRSSSKKLIRSELSSTISFLGFPLGHACLIQGITTVVGLRLGPAAVVEFSVVRTLAGFIRQFASTIYYSIWPEFTQTLSLGDHTIARSLHRSGFQVTLLFSLASALGIYMFGDWIFAIWTGGKLLPGREFLLWMLLSTIPNTLWMMSSYVSISINRHSPIALFYSLSAIIAMTACYFLLPYLGLMAVPVSTLLCDISTLYFVLHRSFLIVKDSSWAFLNYIVSPVSLKDMVKYREL